jgi:toxin ParE1/3/4
MGKLFRSPQVETDLCEIVDYIAANNPTAAFHWLDTMEQLFQLLSEQPHMGERLKTNRYGEVRRFSMANYVIYYRPVPTGAEILRVIHGARDQSRLL